MRLARRDRARGQVIRRVATAVGALVFTALLPGCPRPDTSLQPVDYQQVPRLPAPAAGSYNRGLEAPSDAPVARLVDGKRWDASLAGAAAGVALELVKSDAERVVTRWMVREAAWRAGWAYPIDEARAWTAQEDGAPPPMLLAWLEAHPADADLGLVRARSNDGDLWVGLRSTPRADLGRIPRQLAEGGRLNLPALPGGTYEIADANGLLQTGSLDQPVTIPCNAMGEWLVRIQQAEQLVAQFPVYVGLVPPELPLLEGGRAIRDPVDAIERTEELLADVRDAYGVPPVGRDFMLDAGARSMLRDPSTTSAGVVQSLGLDPDATTIWRCERSSVDACLDTMIWQPRSRRALLATGSALGLAADLAPEGVRVVGILSRTD